MFTRLKVTNRDSLRRGDKPQRRSISATARQWCALTSSYSSKGRYHSSHSYGPRWCAWPFLQSYLDGHRDDLCYCSWGFGSTKQSIHNILTYVTRY